MPFTLGVILVCTAVYSATRLLTTDAIFEPLRARLDAWAQAGVANLDKHRAPTRGQRFAAWAVELLSCVWCASMWVGTFAALCWWWALPSLSAPAFWVPVVALTARAFTGIVTVAVARLDD